MFTAVPGQFTRTPRSSSDAFTFSGRLRGHALKRGGYRLVATPWAGGREGRPTLTSFSIIG